MIEICALASGSNGNCYYIGNSHEAVLIDAGISCKQILLRINQKGLDPNRIRAVFISHEHTDHVRGARVFGNKLKILPFLKFFFELPLLLIFLLQIFLNLVAIK